MGIQKEETWLIGPVVQVLTFQPGRQRLLGPSICHLVYESREEVEIRVRVYMGLCGTPEIEKSLRVRMESIGFINIVGTMKAS